MTKIATLKKRWMVEPGFKEAYEESRAEFEMAHQLIEARIQRGLSQDQLAELMETSQSTIARLESGRAMPSLKTLRRFAEAINSEVQISFKPLKSAKPRVAA